ncbi:hypothetical protein J2128_001579 [Methanomicrobium sp. W14]|uniref:CRISPR-associated endonuclease Cas6 n=1 Tax=Methanomicrobium sp. W14 TaxID=2817839 RepID=UPI001FD8F50E|nr:CRISPR-associated endonuclease Cas6 [Methanomicrobium sp. W14]MBP2133625.1 hypothetical protein [Methanomicrobium sp. W14]
MTELEIFMLKLYSDSEIKGSASQLRGFFATKFNEYVLLHQHNADSLIYRYPFVQYKIIDNVPVVIGINEGAKVLKEIYDKYGSIRLGSAVYEICEKDIRLNKSEFGLTGEFHAYRFLTPWIGLNQENYHRYYGLKNSEERNDFLRRILTGNILSMSKSLGYTVPDRIKCDLKLKPYKTSVKSITHMGFLGKFYVNFRIPDYMGLGKSVSRGFGAVEEIK